MAYTGTLCTEAEINAFAGELVDATGNTEANHNYWVAHAESYLCVLSKYNWIDHYAGLNADVKAILSEYCARYAAICAITYNVLGYITAIGGSTTQTENLINIQLWRIRNIEKLLSNQDYIKYITGA